jgi:hypothetical protein
MPKWLYKLIAKICKRRVEIRPISPYYPAAAVVYTSVLGKKETSRNTVKIPFNADGHIILDYLMTHEPFVTKVKIFYPKGWDDLVISYRKHQRERLRIAEETYVEESGFHAKAYIR